MKALLDTHTFLWAVSGNKKLSPRGAKIFAAPSDLWVSIGSIWEILIKVQVGKLPCLDLRVPNVKTLAENKVETLAINLDHVLRLETLPLHHRDPFDRMLIAQAIEEDSQLDSCTSVNVLAPSHSGLPDCSARVFF